jgi:hypothetical protein
MKRVVVILIAVMALFTSSISIENTNQFVLEGHIKGISKGEIFLHFFDKGDLKLDTCRIINGHFRFTGNHPSPVIGTLRLKVQREGVEVTLRKNVMMENLRMSYEGSVSNFSGGTITGSINQADMEAFEKGRKAIELKYKKQKLALGKYDPKASDAQKAILRQGQEKVKKEKKAALKQFKKEYLWNNPKAYYSAYLVDRDTQDRTFERIYAIVKDLHPDLKKQPMVAKVVKRVENMRKLEIGLDKIMDGVKPVAYGLDQKYKGKRVLNVIYLASFKDNNLCALRKDGTVLIMDVTGKILKRFKPVVKGKPISIAVDTKDQIYVMSSELKEVKNKVRGRLVVRVLPVGVTCHIFTKEGKEVNQFDLPGVHIASGSRVVDQHLIVSDCKLKKIQIHKLLNGELVKEIDDMRACCGILDFSVNKNKEIIVANLGAFRVQGFDYNGNSLMAFGKRGKEIGDFHGCCNPVSVATLSNGAIVTVEKDPTRIKVYSKDGAKQIEGIEELVKGCTYIPMIVDANDNLYLASEEKGIVKCVVVR